MNNEAVESGVITKVERQKRTKDRYNLYIDEQFAFSVHEDLLIKYKLVKGTVISRSEMGEIIRAQDKQQAYLDAIRLLSSRLRSEHELQIRLKHKGYDPPLIAETLERLRQEQYVNDALFAEMLTKQRITSQKKGRNWVRQELQQRGLQPEQITQAINQVDEETEYSFAYELAKKKYLSESRSDTAKAARKTIAFLQRRGYSFGVVSRVMRQLDSGIDEETEGETMPEFE